MTTFKLLLVAMIAAMFGGSSAFAADCPDGYAMDDYSKTCVSQCRFQGGATKWDASVHGCVPTCNQDAGYLWDSEHSRCASRCERGREWDVNTASCECPAGQTWYEEYKVCLATGEFLRRADADRAEAKRAQDAVNAQATSCPEGTKWNLGAETCEGRCNGKNGNPDGYWDKRAKACVCPTGTSWHSIGSGGCY